METSVRPRSLAWIDDCLRTTGRLIRSELFGHDDDAWLGAVIDSRGDCSRRVFFALKGDRDDGHRFAENARSNGCCAIVVEREDTAAELAKSQTPVFRVDDALNSLQDLSREFRATLNSRVVAVTGSAGKTTTKEYLRLILRKKYKVSSNPGNLNNHIGVPLTVLETDEESEYLVSEVGANHLGEVAFLAGILKPDIGVITNIGDAHIGLFGSREGIATAKAELLASIEREGHAVLPADDEYIHVLRGTAVCRVATFGYSDRSDFRITSVDDTGERIAFKINGLSLTLKSFGVYNLLNAAAAFAVGDVCGIEPESACEALAEAEPIPRRSRVYRWGGLVIVDDSYNANPSSMRASLEALQRIEGSRHLAVLGDMAELGRYSEEAHHEMGRFIARSSVDRLYWLGKSGDIVREGAGHKMKKTVRVFAAIDELCDALDEELKPGDVVLVKGSRAAGLERAVDHIRGRIAGESDQ